MFQTFRTLLAFPLFQPLLGHNGSNREHLGEARLPTRSASQRARFGVDVFQPFTFICVGTNAYFFLLFFNTASRQ